MKAFLLAGGRGERLRPLTLSCPKCLVPINGVPLLGIWLDRCRQEGVDGVLLNVSHHAEQVREFLARRVEPPRVELVVETEPRGTAGTVSANRWFVEGDETFWIIYADNLTDLSLGAMLATHRANRGVLTMALCHAPILPPPESWNCCRTVASPRSRRNHGGRGATWRTRGSTRPAPSCSGSCRPRRAESWISGSTSFRDSQEGCTGT